MSLTLNSTDINIKIFDYLKFEELLNLYKTNKILITDIEKYTILKYKKSFKELYLDNKCLHCNNLCDHIKFKLCDTCTCDTCWNCYSKVGSINLYTRQIYNFYQLKCIEKCIYKCRSCNKSYNGKKNVAIDKCTITCVSCKIFKHN